MYILIYDAGGSERAVVKNLDGRVGGSIPLRFKSLTEASRYVHKHRLYDTYKDLNIVEESNNETI